MNTVMNLRVLVEWVGAVETMKRLRCAPFRASPHTDCINEGILR
jgi:hypothetical protein